MDEFRESSFEVKLKMSKRKKDLRVAEPEPPRISDAEALVEVGKSDAEANKYVALLGLVGTVIKCLTSIILACIGSPVILEFVGHIYSKP